MELGLLVLVSYFLPSIVASSRKHHSAGSVFVLNLFLGWTFIGWVVALAGPVAASSLQRRLPCR